MLCVSLYILWVLVHIFIDFQLFCSSPGRAWRGVFHFVSVAFVDHLQEATVEVEERGERTVLLRAGGRGRACWRSACCALHYPCEDS